MPSTSKKQHNFMEAVAHNPSFAKKAGVPQSVGKDFSSVDKGRKFSKGGDMKKMNMGGMAGMHKMPDGKIMKDSAMKKMNMGGMSNGGSASKRADGVATQGKTKGKMLKKGGMAC